jgi:hypothetical protein
MNKKEIAERELNGEELLFLGDKMGNLFDCMDEYSKQQSIAFAEFINTWEWYKYNTGWANDATTVPISTDELYNLFIEYKQC